MPLHEGKSKKVISENISEMEDNGHPHDQAVAASLHNAHPNGGKNMNEGGIAEPNDNKFATDIGRGIKDGINHDSDAVKSYLSSKFAGLLRPFTEEASYRPTPSDLSLSNAPDEQFALTGQENKDEPNEMYALTGQKGMAGGGYPHVTFMENETPEEVKKITHMSSLPPKMEKGGVVQGADGSARDKEPGKAADIDMSHEKKLSSIYKAMGIKKYADGGETIGPPSDAPVSFQDKLAQVLHSIGLGKTQQGADNVAALSAIPGAVGNTMGNVLPTMPGVAEGASKIASTPGITQAINAGLGTNLADPANPVATTAPPPVIPPVVPPTATTPKLAVSPTPASNQAPGAYELKNLFNQDTSKLTEGVNAEDRNALVNKIGTQQHGLGAVIAQAVAGLGDALAAKGGKEQHSLQGIFSMQKQQRDEALANFDKARQDRIQKLALQTQMGSNSIQKLAAQDAYGVDEHLNKMLGAPAGTAHKDLPLYFQMKSAEVAQQEKDADLYMKAHAQAAGEVDAAVKNASVLSIKPSPAQLQASGAKLADQYYNKAKGNLLVVPSDGGAAQWIPAKNLAKAKQIDPNLQIKS